MSFKSPGWWMALCLVLGLAGGYGFAWWQIKSDQQITAEEAAATPEAPEAAQADDGNQPIDSKPEEVLGQDLVLGKKARQVLRARAREPLVCLYYDRETKKMGPEPTDADMEPKSKTMMYLVKCDQKLYLTPHEKRPENGFTVRDLVPFEP